jgi:hypothetical protein
VIANEQGGILDQYEQSDIPKGNFLLLKFKWNGPQDDLRITEAEKLKPTMMFHGTTPDTIVPIALARGLVTLTEKDGPHTESHIDEAAAYFAPGDMSKNSHARLYASPSRLFKDGQEDDCLSKINELSKDNASTIRVYLKCTGYGDKIANSSEAQKKKHEICFGPGKFTIDELWITIGEKQDTEKAVSYFAMPEKITCTDTDEAKQHLERKEPYFVYVNDSLRRVQSEPWHRWTVTEWNPKKWAIQY